MTSSREEAVDAFALGALHYLVKPLEQAQVDAALKRVNDKQVFDQKKLILPKSRWPDRDLAQPNPLH